MTAEDTGAKNAYIGDKCIAKCAIRLAKSEAEKEEFVTVSPDGDDVEHYARLFNVEFQWPNELREVPRTAEPLPVCFRPWSTKHLAKCIKAPGPSGMVNETVQLLPDVV